MVAADGEDNVETVNAERHCTGRTLLVFVLLCYAVGTFSN